MNLVEFRTEEEKIEYIRFIDGVTKSINSYLESFQQAKENSSDLDGVLEKANDIAYMLYTLNIVSNAERDKYLPEETPLIWAQEKTILDCLHNAASQVRIGNECGSYDIEKVDIINGTALKKIFINTLNKTNLSQKDNENVIFNKEGENIRNR